ncbi:unnamed protein product [Urochloa humidicola]
MRRSTTLVRAETCFPLSIPTSPLPASEESPPSHFGTDNAVFKIHLQDLLRLFFTKLQEVSRWPITCKHSS